MATQNPIESEGTYPLPEAQVDRFMLKVARRLPDADEEMTVVQRSLAGPADVRAGARPRRRCAALQRPRRGVYVDPASISYAVALATATRDPARTAWPSWRRTSPSAPARAARSAWSTRARALALLRGATTCSPQDVHELAKDVLRHRLVLSYQALAEEVSAGRRSWTRILETVPSPRLELGEDGRA